MALSKEDIHGIMPPVVTPFTEDEELDLEAFVREVRYMLEHDIGAVLIGAATGEGYALSADELATLYRTAVEEVGGKVPVLAGIITTSTRDAILRANLAREAGADAVMVTPVIYFSPSDDGLYDYFETIGREASLPIMVYNAVPRTPVSPQLVRRLAEIPQVISVKQGMGATLDGLSETLRTVGDHISVTWSQDAALFSGYALGAAGSLASIDSVLPQQTINLFKAVQSGDLDAARQLHQGIWGVVDAMGGGAYDWPAAVKVAINLQGRAVGPARGPYAQVSPEQEADIRVALEAVGALRADTAKASPQLP